MATPSLTVLRVYAWLIDLLIVLGVSAMFNIFAWAAGMGYFLFRDGLFQGQSVGKRLMGMKVVVGKPRARATFLNSFVRNLLWVIPFVNFFMGVTGLYYLCYDAAGRHWGDRLADTRVVKA